MTADHYEAHDREYDETQELLTMTDNNQYVVRTKNNDPDTGEPHLFWSNVDGWGDLLSATVFTKAETEYDGMPMPPGDAPVEWVALDAATRLTMSENIKSECIRRYSAHPGGQVAVFDFINENYPLIPWAWCKPCESDSPMLGDECLVCGTKREDILPSPEEIIRDYTDWCRRIKREGSRYSDIDSVDTDPSGLTITYVDGTMLRLNMTTEYVGNRDHADAYDDFDMGENNG